MREVIRSHILHLLQKDDTPRKLVHLEQELGVRGELKRGFHEAIESLCAEGRIIVGPGNVVRLPSMSSEITGVFKANARGYGFITPEQAGMEGDLFIPANATGNAMTGDRVVARIKRQKRRGPLQRRDRPDPGPRPQDRGRHAATGDRRLAGPAGRRGFPSAHPDRRHQRASGPPWRQGVGRNPRVSDPFPAGSRGDYGGPGSAGPVRHGDLGRDPASRPVRRVRSVQPGRGQQRQDRPSIRTTRGIARTWPAR